MDRRRALRVVAAGLGLVAAACAAPKRMPGLEATLPGLPVPGLQEEVSAQIPLYVEAARAWLVEVPEPARARALLLVHPDAHVGVEHGLLALSERCPYDGVVITNCAPSAWFECTGCGTKFDRLGAKKAGPARRGMFMHAIRIDADENVAVVPTPLLPGIPTGLAIVGHQPAGPFCA